MTRRDVMPHSMRHPCGSSKPVMVPRVALRLPEDDKERGAMLENNWEKGVKLDVKWHPWRLSEEDGSPGQARG